MARNGRMNTVRTRVAVLGMVAVTAGGVALFGGRHIATQAKGKSSAPTSGYTSGMLAGPAYLAAGTSGAMYATSTDDNRVVRFNARGTITARAHVTLRGPRGMAIDRAGNVYVAESLGCRITKLSPNLQAAGGWSTCGGRSEGYDGPLALAFGPTSQLYATSRGSSRIEVFSPNGTLLRWINTLGSRVEFGGMAVDPHGNIYLTDPEFGHVLKIPAGTTRIEQWGRYGSAPGTFNDPTAITVDRAGNVYVAEVGNARIQKLSPTGKPLAIWGRGGAGNARIDNPTGLTLDAAGNLYVAGQHGEVQKLSPAGQVLAIWR